MQTRWKIGALALAALIATGATMVACSAH